MFLHGLRVSEACGLVLEPVNIESRVLHVARLESSSRGLGRSFFLSDQRKPLRRSIVNPMLHQCGEKS